VFLIGRSSLLQDGRLLTVNPYSLPDQPLAELRRDIAQLVFNNKGFSKKVIEDDASSQDARQLMVYLCWENANYTGELLSELLWQVRTSTCSQHFLSRCYCCLPMELIFLWGTRCKPIFPWETSSQRLSMPIPVRTS